LNIEPKPGLVIRYDYLWNSEKKAGREDGYKDRPCSIVVAAPEKADGSRQVWLCAITHSPPEQGQTAVEIPPKVAQQLGLDQQKSWIKTHEVNSLTWEKGRLPHGITQAKSGQWEFGQLPQALRKKVFSQVKESSRTRQLYNVKRDSPAPKISQSSVQKANALSAHQARQERMAARVKSIRVSSAPKIQDKGNERD